jgi:hypothetical protein
VFLCAVQVQLFRAMGYSLLQHLVGVWSSNRGYAMKTC